MARKSAPAARGNQRPFWLHQVVEYILGGMLVFSGLQSPTPLVPAIGGGLITVHAALSKGGAAAFRLIPIQLHRVIDPIIIAVCIVGALQPFIEVDSSARLTTLGIAFFHGFVWWNTKFTAPARRGSGRGSRPAQSADPQAPAAQPDESGLSATIGKTAGRLAGGAVRAVKAKRSSTD